VIVVTVFVFCYLLLACMWRNLGLISEDDNNEAAVVASLRGDLISERSPDIDDRS
jgi:hypothetical protein